MNARLQEIFKPLQDCIHDHNLGPADLMELIAGFYGTSPRTAQALCLHARDYFEERGEEATTYTEVIAEVYRRAFFDPEYTHKYETGIAFPDDKTYAAFVEYLVTSMSMDQHQHDAGSFHEPPVNRQ